LPDPGQKEKLFIGDEADYFKGISTLHHPTKYGIVENWDYMEKIWDYTFSNQLRVDSSETFTMLTEAPRNPKMNREKMCEVMFENFDVQGFYVAIQAVLSIYANGRTTGLVCDSGDGVSHTVPVFEGFSINAAIGRNEIAGRVVTDYLERLWEHEIGRPRVCGNFREVMRTVKETPDMMFVTLDK